MKIVIKILLLIVLHFECLAANSAEKTSKIESREIAKNANCLLRNAFYESKIGKSEDIAPIAHVIRNRISSKFYPNSICDVVLQRSQSGVCQFSWACESHSSYARYMNVGLARRILHLSCESFLSRDTVDDPYKTATHYHAKNVKPFWAMKLDYVAKTEWHYYYRDEKLSRDIYSFNYIRFCRELGDQNDNYIAQLIY